MKTKLIKISASLKLTLFCLTCLLVLTFVGTLDQVNLGIYYAQKKYFQSFFVFWEPVSGIKLPIFPGGFAIGWLLIINLLTAVITQKLYVPKKIGLFLSHLGLAILIVGSGLSSYWGIESQLIFEEGQTKQYTEAQRHSELVVSRSLTENEDEIVGIPDTILSEKKVVSHPKLPFTIHIDEYFPNAQLFRREGVGSFGEKQKEIKGVGGRVAIKELPITVKDDELNMSTAVITLKKDKNVLGTWLVSRALGASQTVKVQGRSYTLKMREMRYYLPYKLTLKDFKHDRYAGTNTPKNFSSLVAIEDAEKKEFRDVLIYMNHPLRYRGKTFYQASFGKEDTLSVLQVVENPVWLLPYISCGLMTIGLVWHFLIMLGRFSQRRNS
ncbi:hypothetical protein DID77_04015 [Candidatus Marinamargulisbacteria bacterium SCGC AG-439-L15]|nr:hypothetical protein DID77_04015 [Candidatus Marinamargulisbacteria bacterium SCGC AG-439-L15]